MEFNEYHPLIEDLVEFASEHDIEIIFSHELDPYTPDIADIQQRKVIINLNSALSDFLPFRMTHECGHILDPNNDNIRIASFENYDSNNVAERFANTMGVSILLDHRLNNGGQFNYIDFMRMYGLPAWTEPKVREQMENRYY